MAKWIGVPDKIEELVTIIILLSTTVASVSVPKRSMPLPVKISIWEDKSEIELSKVKSVGISISICPQSAGTSSSKVNFKSIETSSRHPSGVDKVPVPGDTGGLNTE